MNISSFRLVVCLFGLIMSNNFSSFAVSRVPEVPLACLDVTNEPHVCLDPEAAQQPKCQAYAFGSGTWAI